MSESSQRSLPYDNNHINTCFTLLQLSVEEIFLLTFECGATSAAADAATKGTVWEERDCDVAKERYLYQLICS